MGRRQLMWVIACYCGTLSAEDNPVMRMLLTDYKPLIDLSREDKGPHAKRVLGILDTIGQPYRIEEFSWSRIGKMLYEEDVCSFGWLKNPKRQAHWRYSAPYTVEVSYLYGRKDNPVTLTSLEDIRSYRVGVTRGFSYGEKLDAVLDTMETDESNTDQANIRKLIAGRIDLYATESSVMQGLLSSYPAKDIRAIEPKLKVSELEHHLVCHIDSVVGAKAIAAFDQFLKNQADKP